MLLTLIVALLWLLVIVGVCWVGFWLVDSAGVPNPINWIAKAVVALIGLYAIFQYVLPIAGLHL